MFGSKDNKRTPAPSSVQPPALAEPAVKTKNTGLFGWLRRKPAALAAQPSPLPGPVSSFARFRINAGAEVCHAAQSRVAPAPTPSVALEVEQVSPEPMARESVTPPRVADDVASASASASASAPVADAAAVPVPAPIAPPALELAPAVPAQLPAPTPREAAAPAVLLEKPKEGKESLFQRLRQGLAKTSASLGEGMASLFLGSKALDDDLLEEIETRLLTADVGVEASTAIVESLTKRVARKELADSAALYKALQEELRLLLKPVELPLQIDKAIQPFVILVVGVNGAGKTTTIGKLAKKLQLDGKKVMLAAGDTFRAAAVEQLQVWGERNQIQVIAQHTGADSASVIFDAVQAAKARGVDVLIADTAGRLHTKDNLMEELKKVRRVIGKLDQAAPHEVLLVLDAGTGQNAINQTRQFHQAVDLTGLVLTKLDGTAKGGVIFALAKQFALPIRYIGVGEGIDDLRTFVADEFVQALFAERERT